MHIYTCAFRHICITCGLQLNSLSFWDNGCGLDILKLHCSMKVSHYRNQSTYLSLILQSSVDTGAVKNLFLHRNKYYLNVIEHAIGETSRSKALSIIMPK